MAKGANAFMEFGQKFGLFDYILPFLLIFAIVYGVLKKTKLFDNKKTEIILALIIGLMAIVIKTLKNCLSVILPKLAIALVLVLVIYILSGLFTDPQVEKEKGKKANTFKKILITIAIISFILIIVQSSEACGFSPPSWLPTILPWVILGVTLVLVIYYITKTPLGENKFTPKPYEEKKEERNRNDNKPKPNNEKKPSEEDDLDIY